MESMPESAASVDPATRRQGLLREEKCILRSNSIIERTIISYLKERARKFWNQKRRGTLRDRALTSTDVVNEAARAFVQKGQ